jgi:hypothetical protein
VSSLNRLLFLSYSHSPVLGVHERCRKFTDLSIVFSIPNLIETTCLDFLKIASNGTVVFIHQSIKDFLLSDAFELTIAGSHRSLAKICITYLEFEDLGHLTAEDVKGNSKQVAHDHLPSLGTSCLFWIRVRPIQCLEN